MGGVSEESGPVLGVVGLGRMGAPVLARLSDHFHVLAHDIAAERAACPEVLDADRCVVLADLAVAVDVLITVLPGPIETDAVIRAALPLMRPGALWLDFGSGDPKVTTDLEALVAAHGVAAVSAPMGGGPPEAQAGTLSFFVGGSEAAVRAAGPILTRLAAPGGVRMCGSRASDGQVVKLLANALWFANAVAAAEALLIAEAHGVGAAHALELLSASAGSSVALNHYLPKVLVDDYLPEFGIDRVVDELHAVRDLARVHRIPTALLDASLVTHTDALAAFGPELGELLGVRLLEERSGRRIC